MVEKNNSDINLHIHVGPGHHDKILLQELRRHQIKFTCSSYYPAYQFGYNDNNRFSPDERSSALYNMISYFAGALTNRLDFIKRNNFHYDVLYTIYDRITASRLTKDCKLLWGWPHVSLTCLRKVKKNDGVTVLDYPIPHISTWRNLLDEEGRLLGVKKMHSQFSSVSYKRMIREIEETDFISVPSTFVKRSFIENGVPEKKLLFNPYGIDTKLFHEKHYEENANAQVFKIIFVGSIELRKGVQYLLKAFDKLNLPECELHLIGHIHQDFQGIIQKYSSNKKIIFRGQLTKDNVAAEMRLSHVLIMPSILEGLSLTVLEAMACGTPVISSENAGGLDVIEEGKNGFLFPIRDIDSLVDKIRYCYLHRETLISLGRKAAESVRANFTAIHYGNRVVNTIKSLKTLPFPQA